MTEKIYLENSYAKETDAVVTAVNGNEIELDQTIFYPTGGGQPCDTGTISSGSGATAVTAVRKDGDRVIHTLGDAAGIAEGTKVHCMLDWERRYMHMRLHTALHIIDGIVEKRYSGRITGGQIYDDKARMDFDVPGLDKAKAQNIIEDAQKVVDENHKVTAKFLTKEEAAAVPNIARTAPGEELLDKLDKIRIIDIGGFDFQLDGGTHVARTGEVGSIDIAKYENKGSHNKRIEIRLSGL